MLHNARVCVCINIWHYGFVIEVFWVGLTVCFLRKFQVAGKVQELRGEAILDKAKNYTSMITSFRHMCMYMYRNTVLYVHICLTVYIIGIT